MTKGKSWYLVASNNQLVVMIENSNDYVVRDNYVSLAHIPFGEGFI